ncbi:MAG TPA: ABC transporter substrate-binding protein [Firmicutes bacterium]|nr:ABC transporter substrate-binding protein [Bacillota bacterium]
MKRVIQMFIAVLAAAALCMYATARINHLQGYSSGNTLTIYNWGDYIDPDLITAFEEETGIKVIYETYESNEAMLTKIAHGGHSFDIAVPSDYTISRMIEQNMLIPLDHSLIPNLKYIDERFLDLSFDPGNKYSIPYFWGTVGIAYNREMLEGKEITSWNDLWDESLRNQILLVDGAREVIGMALNSLGYSLNETDPEKLLEAQQKLFDLVPNVRAIVGDEIKMLLSTEEAAVGIVWSGEAGAILDENPNLDYVIPTEGSNIWFDNMVIPVTARNVEAAHKFINFMLDPENAAQNTLYVGYSTPNWAAMEYLPEELINDERFYPGREITDKLELYENLGKHNQAYYNELFLEFKMHRK